MQGPGDAPRGPGERFLPPPRARVLRLPGGLLGAALGVVAVAAGFALSLVLLAVLLAGGLLVGGYVWWRTRHLRRALREAARQGANTPASPGGESVTLEGEFVREGTNSDRPGAT